MDRELGFHFDKWIGADVCYDVVGYCPRRLVLGQAPDYISTHDRGRRSHRYGCSLLVALVVSHNGYWIRDRHI